MIWFFKIKIIIENSWSIIIDWIMGKYYIVLSYYVGKFQQIEIFE